MPQISRTYYPRSRELSPVFRARQDQIHRRPSPLPLGNPAGPCLETTPGTKRCSQSGSGQKADNVLVFFTVRI